MKALVFSDTHGRINSTIDIIKSHKNVDLIIHLGDLTKDVDDLKAIFKDIKFECISGNNDYDMDYPLEKIIDFDNKKLFLTHGHIYGVKFGCEGLIIKGKQLKVDGVLFGHTHKTHEEIVDNILCFNPGSMSLPVKSPSYGIIETKEDKLFSMICSL